MAHKKTVIFTLFTLISVYTHTAELPADLTYDTKGETAETSSDVTGKYSTPEHVTGTYSSTEEMPGEFSSTEEMPGEFSSTEPLTSTEEARIQRADEAARRRFSSDDVPRGRRFSRPVEPDVQEELEKQKPLTSGEGKERYRTKKPRISGEGYSSTGYTWRQPTEKDTDAEELTIDDE